MKSLVSSVPHHVSRRYGNTEQLDFIKGKWESDNIMVFPANTKTKTRISRVLVYIYLS
jgi:hypothetical protein